MQESEAAVDEVARESAALEQECRLLMQQPEMLEFVRDARLPKDQVLQSLEQGTRNVRKRLAL